MEQITKLSVDILKVHPRNTEFFDDIQGEQYEKFKNSIEEDGILTPLIVSPDMTIISGHQRYQAAKDLNIGLVPVIIKEELLDEDEKLKKLLATNFGRLKNDPVKQANFFVEYEKMCGISHGGNQYTINGYTQEKMAKELGVSTKTIQRTKSILNLVSELKNMITDGDIPYTTAINIFSRMSKEEQFEVISKIDVKGKSAREIKKEISNINGSRYIPKSIENHLISRTEGRCEICGWGNLNMISIMEKHHVKPMSEGGDNELNNLSLLCPTCHKIVHVLRDEKEKEIKNELLNELKNNNFIKFLGGIRV